MSAEIALDEVSGPGDLIIDSVRRWRADCKSGQFKIGESGFRGGKISMELVAAQTSDGEYFGYPRQRWLALMFIDGDGALSSILLKTESMDNFDELRRSYRSKGETLLGKTIQASMEKRASRRGFQYYSVTFSVISDGKYSREISEFRRSMNPASMLPDLKDVPVVQLND